MHKIGKNHIRFQYNQAVLVKILYFVLFSPTAKTGKNDKFLFFFFFYSVTTMCLKNIMKISSCLGKAQGPS